MYMYVDDYSSLDINSVPLPSCLPPFLPSFLSLPPSLPPSFFFLPPSLPPSLSHSQVEDRLVCTHKHSQITDIFTDKSKPLVKALVIPPAPNTYRYIHTYMYVCIP